MQPLAVRIRAARRRLVVETETDVHAALITAEQEADATGALALVDFEAANGNTLSLLVGGADTALSFRYAGSGAPKFVSMGDAQARGTVEFSRDAQELVNWPRWALIPRVSGLSALDEFAASNELPECVEWKPCNT